MTEQSQQAIAFPFNRGLDTKTDAKMVQAPYLTVLENGVFQSGDTIQKRNGFNQLPNAIQGGGTLAATALCAHNNELVAFDGTKAYSYASATQQWLSKGTAYGAGVSVTDIIHNANFHGNGDSATANGVTVFAYAENSGNSPAGGTVSFIRASVVDNTTGAYYQRDVSISGAGNPSTAPRCVASGNFVYIFWGDSIATALKVALINTTIPGSIAVASRTVAANWSSATANSFGIDAVAASNSTALVGYANAAGSASLAYVDTTGTLVVSPAAVTFGAANTVSVNLVVDSQFAYVHVFDSTVGKCTVFSRVLANLANNSGWAAGGVQVDTAVPYVAAGLIVNGALTWLSSVQSGTTTRTVTQALSNGAVTVAAAVYLQGLVMVAKPFLYNSKLFVCVGNVSTLQPAYFVLDSGGAVYSMHLLGYAPGFIFGQQAQDHMMPNVLASGTTVTWVLPKVGANGVLASATGLAQLGLNFAQSGAYAPAKVGNQTHFTGAIVQGYDGAQVVEHGFLQFPEGITLNSTPAVGGSMSNGTYLYKVVYEWEDAVGQVHRSAPSAAFSVTLSGGTATQRVILNVPPCRPTNKSKVVIAVYRTANGASTVFNNVNPPNWVSYSPVISDPALASQTFTDVSSDATIAAFAILYTVGGELGNDPPPPTSIVAAGKGRIFYVPSEDPNTVGYTKQQVFGLGMGFSLALSKRIYSTGGPVTALAVMDDKVIVFKSGTLLWFSGDGPTNAGTNDQFTDAQLISSDVGCTVPASLITTSQGLFFSSAKGIYLLDRALRLSYIGAPVESFNAQLITGATLLPVPNQVRFVVSSGNALACNYFYHAVAPASAGEEDAGQWSSFTNHAALAATTWMGVYTVLKPNGRVWTESTGYLDGDGSAISMRIRTSCFKMPSVSGFARINEWALLGVFKSPHNLIIKAYYDFSLIASTTLTFSTATGIAVPIWGQGKWGDGMWGSPGSDVYQMRNRPPTQLCESVQLEFYDDFTGITGPAGEGYAVNNLTLLVDPQTGLARLNTAKTL